MKILGIIVFNLFLTPVFIKLHGTPDVYSTPAFRLMEFFIGVILMHIYQISLKDNVYCRRWLYKWKAFFVEMTVLVFVVGCMVYMQFEVNNYSLYNWLVIPLFMMQILTLMGTSSDILKSGLVRYLSATAYGVYLAQYFCWDVSLWIYDVFNVEKNTFRIIICVIVCILLAGILHEIFEKKAKRFLMNWMG